MISKVALFALFAAFDAGVGCTEVMDDYKWFELGLCSA